MSGFLANGILILALIVQVNLSASLKDVRAYAEIVEVAPTNRYLAAAAFGDNELLYRRLVMDLQNAGDTGGRWSALEDYDMRRVVDWLNALDSLDHRANHHMVLAANYFSQTQAMPDLVHLVKYIQSHVAGDPERKLYWLNQALLMAERRLEDKDLILDIADQLGSYDFPAMTPVAYILPAKVYEKWGDYEGAATYMERAIDKLGARISADERQVLEAYVTAMRRQTSP